MWLHAGVVAIDKERKFLCARVCVRESVRASETGRERGREERKGSSERARQEKKVEKKESKRGGERSDGGRGVERERSEGARETHAVTVQSHQRYVSDRISTRQMWGIATAMQ